MVGIVMFGFSIKKVGLIVGALLLLIIVTFVIRKCNFKSPYESLQDIEKKIEEKITPVRARINKDIDARIKEVDRKRDSQIKVLKDEIDRLRAESSRKVDNEITRVKDNPSAVVNLANQLFAPGQLDTIRKSRGVSPADSIYPTR